MTEPGSNSSLKKYFKHQDVNNKALNKSGSVITDDGESVSVRCAGNVESWSKSDIDLIVHVYLSP